ncbi:hypothetical protein RhiLY_00366 [Ceratobasidium sp. AG-Ba]|nr:hypothetical protein RhiLY_00366 [Ceratobasidium sp. AG-Ba]
MVLLTLLVSIPLASILLSLPGFAPYIHAFVNIAKYPAYSYFIWQYAPSALRRLPMVDCLALRIDRLAQAYYSTRQTLTPRYLLYVAVISFTWVLQTVVTRSGLFVPFLVGSNVLAGCWRNVAGPLASLQPARRTPLKVA